VAAASALPEGGPLQQAGGGHAVWAAAATQYGRVAATQYGRVANSLDGGDGPLYRRPMHELLRPAAVAAGVPPEEAELLDVAIEPIAGSTGAATAAVTRISGQVRAGLRTTPFALVRKTFRPVTSVRHAAAAREPEHWAYWRRELLAYAAQVVPSGPHLYAPRCFAVSGDAVYLADICGPAERAATAAARLGAWQAGTALPDVPWLSGPQLAQRVAVSSLDWSAVRAPAVLRHIWQRRAALLAALACVPAVICHGDFHRGNLVATGGTTTVLDWGTLGVGPLGADLAHLALSTGEDLLDAYRAGLGDKFDPTSVARGYHTTVVLTAASRAHWMLSRGVPVPARYLAAAVAGIDHLDG
jgi:Phosphotransferase enzyme family